MARLHKLTKSCPGSRVRKAVHKSQFICPSTLPSRGVEHVTVEGFIRSVEQDVEAQREIVDLSEIE